MNVIDLLKKHESFKSRVYHCTANKKNIGYGYNLDANPLHLSVFELDRFKNKGITEKTAENLLIDQVYKIKFALDKAIPWWLMTNQPRRDVLIVMAYKIGIDEMLKFEKMLNYFAVGAYQKAAEEMLESTWTKQVDDCADELAEMIKSGKYNNVEAH